MTGCRGRLLGLKSWLHHRWVACPWIDFLFNISVWQSMCSTDNHSTYLTVVVRSKWINVCAWLMEKQCSCHPWSWWRWPTWLLGNWCQGTKFKVGYRRWLQSHVSWFCSTITASAKLKPGRFIHSTWQVWVPRCAFVRSPGGVASLHWIVLNVWNTHTGFQRPSKS